MKKLILLGFALMMSFYSINSNAQTLDSVVTTTSIVCYGDFAIVTAYMTQTTPGTQVKLLNYRFSGSLLFSSGSSGVTTGASQPFSGMISNCYRMLMVDSILFYTAFPPGPNSPPQPQLQNPTHPSILGYVDYCVDNVPQLVVTTTQTSINLCNGDCDASENLSISGGTPPYSITINGVTNILGLFSIDTTYLNLCADTYSATIVDFNGCSTAPWPATTPTVTNFTITEPPELILNGSVTSDYSGEDISCFGEDDGEITGDVSGGTPPYTFSLDGITYGSSSIFSGLLAGTYTVYYQDNNGCDTSETITLNNPPDLSGVISISSQVSCFEICDGELTFQVNNILSGTSPYTYSIDGVSFQNSPIFTGLCGDTIYSITVMDANGCTFNVNKFLPEPTQISFSDSLSDYNGFNISCFGFSDGSIHFQNISGGNSPYTYSIDGVTFSTSMNHTGLLAGTYPITVRDANGCTEEIPVTLTEPDEFLINVIIDNSISCPGICDAEVSVSPNNGVAPILYTMTGYSPQTTQSWFGMCGDITFPSQYTLDAIDGNGCTASTNFTLTEPLPFVYTVDSNPEYCGDSNGIASIFITQGGTLNYAYLWDDLSAQTTAIATNLITGMYEVRVTDFNGCQFTENIFVTESDITLSFDSIPPCDGGLGGQATANANGVPPYSYNWITTGETTQTITGLSSGYYTVTVIDANGCTVTDSIEIPVSAVVNITLDAFNSTLSVLCNGFQSDTITVIATGGTGFATYQYNIPGIFPIPQYNNYFIGLYAGTYPVVAVDANGCSDTINVTISEPDVIYFSATSSDVSCNSGSNGTIWVDSVSGGTAPYFYSWSSGQNTSIVNNVPAGNYTVSVTDANSCASNPTQVTVTVNEPTQLTSSINIINHSSCAGSQTAANGAAQASASEGTSGYNYSWTGPIWPTYPFGFSAIGANISLLWPGTYYVDIIDANGCMITDTAIINPGTNPILDVTIQDVSCFGANDGIIFPSANSGTPSYQFSEDGGTTFIPSGINFGPYGQESLFITVIDDEGCTDSDSIFVYEPAELGISSLTFQNVLCYDSANGQITANVFGGTGSYSYVWSNGQTTNPAVDLIPLVYSVIVTDSMACSVTSSIQLITEPDSLSISNIAVTHVSCNGGDDGSAIATVTGGTQSYIYSWSGGSDINLVAGVYTSTITDANGCITSESFTVTEPLTISIQFIRDSVTCLGGSDGWATVLVSGGVGPPYTYLWDNGDITLLADTLDAGYHTVTITDVNLCVLIDSIEILEPSQSIEIDSLIISEITCHDGDNASITVLSTGGQTPYVYSSTNGLFTQNNIGFSNLSPNQYIMYVRDVRGCVDRDTVDIIQPDSLYIDTTIFSHITCNGANDAQINAINAFGGTLPYLYSVNGGAYHANMSYFNGYGPGTYTVEVLDSNNCSAQDIIIIEEPDELDVTITTSNWNGYEVKCNGGNSGYATISINGGNGPYLKTVYDDANNIIYNGNSPIINNLSAGMYTFIVTDNNGCTYSDSLLYQEPTAITHSFVIDSITCMGWTNGSITWNGSGGVGSAITYSYLWNTGDTTYSLSNVGAGIYTMTVTDENNCTTDSSIFIGNGSVLSSGIGSTQNPTCWNYCDGELEVIPSGGVPNINGSGTTMYNYQWDDQLLQITQTAIGLCVDDVTNSQTFICTITDALGCTTTETIILTQPDELELSIWQTGEVQCFGENQGSLSVSTTGGNAGTITYTWNTGSSNPSTSINNLIAGTYVVVAEDSEGCMDTTNYTITEPSVIEADILAADIIDVLCYEDSTGEISVTVNGGTTNILTQYFYAWVTNIGTLSDTFDFVTQTGTGTLSDIDTGLYQVTVTDVNGCTTESNIVYVAQPTNPLSIFMDSTDQSCITEGTATAYVLGGTPTYTYLWSPGGQITAIANALVPNTNYTVLVTDANGCTITDQTYINGYRNVFLPNNDDEIDSTICLGTEIDILVEDQGYEYLWSTGETTASITVIPQDFITIYTLYITDPNCPAPYELEAKFNVIQLDINPVATPNPLVLGEMVIINSSYSYNNFVWTWDNDTATGIEIDDYPESSTWYYVEAMDDLGCKGVDSVYVVVGPIPYDAISPNGDGKNDEWEILDIASYPLADIQIFNRWGSLIYLSTGENYNNNKWNGEHEGKLLPVGTYYYTINLKDGSELQTGAVTIVR